MSLEHEISTGHDLDCTGVVAVDRPQSKRLGAAGNLSLTYGDTVGDLVLSTSGGMIGSAIAVTLFPPRKSTLNYSKEP